MSKGNSANSTESKSNAAATPAAEGEAKGAEQKFQVGIRLQPVNHSDQPVFANFSVVQAAPGMLFLDFGFLEPSVLPSVIRAAQSGGKVPEAVNGRLATRVVLGLDAAMQLAQQLEQHLRGVRAQAQAQRAAAPAEAAPH